MRAPLIFPTSVLLRQKTLKWLVDNSVITIAPYRRRTNYHRPRPLYIQQQVQMLIL